jgi:hypothetical protein
VEVIGERDPAVDVEVISVAWHLFTNLGFYGLRLYINSTGCPVCKPAYIKILADYFSAFADKLPPDDKLRLQKNPLRILDNKEAATRQPSIGLISLITGWSGAWITTPKQSSRSKRMAWAARIRFVAGGAMMASSKCWGGGPRRGLVLAQVSNALSWPSATWA